ncbi:MAG: wax ester/triacylglycerol synthase domain-containing protein [Pseudonocardiaceae bacterium]
MNTPVLPRPVQPIDHAYLNYDRRGRNTSIEFGLLLRFTAAGNHPVTDMRKFIATRLATVPELSLALDRPSRRWRRLTWRRVEPDLDQHVRECTLSPEVGFSGARAMAEEMMSERLPRDRPLWQWTWLRGYAGGEQCALLRVHHALFDGVSLLVMATRLFGVNADVAEAATPLGATVPSLSGFQRLAMVAKATPGYLRRCFPLAGRAFKSRTLTGRRQFAWAETDLSWLHAVARRHGATGNEVYLAALSGALREWPHTPWRLGIRPIWALVPFHVGVTDGSGERGNHAVAFRVRLPCDEPDPRQRLAGIVRDSSQEKSRLSAVTSTEMAALPAWLTRTLFSLTCWRRHADLFAGSSAWLGNPVGFQGISVPEALPMGFLLRGRPIGSALVVYGDRVLFHAVTDSSLPPADVLCRLWVQALNELGNLPPIPGRDITFQAMGRNRG